MVSPDNAALTEALKIFTDNSKILLRECDMMHTEEREAFERALKAIRRDINLHEQFTKDGKNLSGEQIVDHLVTMAYPQIINVWTPNYLVEDTPLCDPLRNFVAATLYLYPEAAALCPEGIKSISDAADKNIIALHSPTEAKALKRGSFDTLQILWDAENRLGIYRTNGGTARVLEDPAISVKVEEAEIVAPELIIPALKSQR
jgi:hypothetical protein